MLRQNTYKANTQLHKTPDKSIQRTTKCTKLPVLVDDDKE